MERRLLLQLTRLRAKSAHPYAAVFPFPWTSARTLVRLKNCSMQWLILFLLAYTDNFANNRNGRTNFCRYAPRNCKSLILQASSLNLVVIFYDAVSSKPPSYHRPESREQLPPDSESDASSIPELESVSSSVAFSLSENLSEEVINVENGQSSILFGTDCTKTAPHQRRTRSFDNFGTLGDLPGPRRVERSFLSASCSPNSLVPVELNAPEGGTEDQLPYLVNSGTWNIHRALHN